MSNLRDELARLEATGAMAIRESLFEMDEFDRRATMLGKYLTPRLARYVNVWGNQVHLTAHPADKVNFINAMAEEAVPLADYPTVNAFLLRKRD